MQIQLNALFLLVVLFFSKITLANHNSVIFNRPADSAQASYALALLTLAYKELNYEVHIIDFNRQNALLAANNGVLDGQLGRDISIEADNKNLIRINYPLFDYKLLLFKNCQPNTLDKLDSIAVLSGYPVQHHYLNEHKFNGNIIEVKNITTQLNLLAQHKVDGAIMLDFVLKADNFSLPESCMQTQLLSTFSLYHYVHKKHAALVSKLLNALNKLHDNGTSRALRAKYNLKL
ncbi:MULTISPECIES: substrate-binding periplasmic protein [unclassified Pseudoalteromonas]|uniref:substrate-binding periplasmic protein n=1 Tax=unclassified Pseudoalteromonas TaxID=194690 RepID=UPI000411E939|nr:MULTISPECIES: transporter substrate-binding domain-containing protein [unclassified Pseudoalteromonas]MDC9496469.1 transporter substrate-binding domain-containing protein [Pseudoalteromonas sp. Angola-20]MDC9517363.1 transporter substrate-binding domain-containing protein [Pseudoalteromonas sp. Angola-22]MDC9533770.1 transporter substrate-binding domain-containing protein [Pseudoalteromonas sp. Angola-9]